MATATRKATRPSPDPVALRIGQRLRAARQRAALTQQQLAGERYTKAYVSALENALVKPSMAALEYLAGRLGVSAAELMADQAPAWSRLEADLLLAAGDWQAAADAYGQLLEGVDDRGLRAELLRGQAEALVRLDHAAEAAARASQAVQLFEALGRETDAVLASYWLAVALHYQDNITEGKSILRAALDKVRGGLDVEPGFKLRLLMALASSDAREGNHRGALSYLEEIRSLAGGLDDRRRATYLFDLAQSYRETGDYEAAIRAGSASLALFRSAAADIETALMENDLALAYVGAEDLHRAEELAVSAHQRLVAAGDSTNLAHVVETEAQIAAARERWPDAMRLAREAHALAESTGNVKAAASALLSLARAQAVLGLGAEAQASFGRAADLARSLDRPALLRRVLTDWADFLASRGSIEEAYALTREALQG